MTPLSKLNRRKISLLLARLAPGNVSLVILFTLRHTAIIRRLTAARERLSRKPLTVAPYLFFTVSLFVSIPILYFYSQATDGWRRKCEAVGGKFEPVNIGYAVAFNCKQ